MSNAKEVLREALRETLREALEPYRWWFDLAKAASKLAADESIDDAERGRRLRELYSQEVAA